MARVSLEARSAQRRRQPAVVRDPNVVPARRIPGCAEVGAMVTAVDMLEQLPAESDVQELMAPADRQHRDVPLQSVFEEGEFHRVAFGRGFFDLRMPFGRMICRRVDVNAAREDQGVERVPQFNDAPGGLFVKVDNVAAGLAGARPVAVDGLGRDVLPAGDADARSSSHADIVPACEVTIHEALVPPSMLQRGSTLRTRLRRALLRGRRRRG